jgi:hypothetical protein
MRTTHRRQLSFPIPSVPHKHARLLASMPTVFGLILAAMDFLLSRCCD